MARRQRPERMLKGRGAHNNEIPFAVLSRVERCVHQKWLDIVGQLEFFVIIRQGFRIFWCMPMGDGIDQRIKVEGWQIGILGFDVNHIRCVIPESLKY
jgi:hypothetical protein